MKAESVNKTPKPAKGLPRDILAGRTVKQFWSVTEYGPKLVYGYACESIGHWWCPSLGYTMIEGLSLFPSEKEAFVAALNEARQEYAVAKAKMDKLAKICSVLQIN